MTHDSSRAGDRRVSGVRRGDAGAQLLSGQAGEVVGRLLCGPRADSWFVNGVAFAGDYLSAASFLGICGMIAFYGYDGFLYSIGYLAGWVVALFVVAEPMKRLGKFTFADALDCAVQFARHQAGGRRQHAGGERVLSDSADGRRRRAGAAAVGLAALGGRGAGGRGGDFHRRDGRHGVDDVGAVHQGIAAGGVQRGADGDDSDARISRPAAAAPMDARFRTTGAVRSSTWTDETSTRVCASWSRRSAGRSGLARTPFVRTRDSERP